MRTLCQALAASSLFLAAGSAVAETDLALPAGEYYSSYYNRLLCTSFDDTNIAAPAGVVDRGLVFKKLSSDRPMDNYLLKAEFKAAGGASTCNYSAVFYMDQTNRRLITLTDSKAFADDGADCSEGKDFLDAQFTPRVDAIWLEHPSRISIRFAFEGAAAVCGEGVEKVGVLFTQRRP